MRRVLVVGVTSVVALLLTRAIAGEPVGLFPLAPRPDPSQCEERVVADRISHAGRRVELRQLTCPNRPPETALRTGDAWFSLPPEFAGLSVFTFRRSTDDRHWVVIGEGRASVEFLRSDDFGESFSHARPPRSALGRGTLYPDATGAVLEHLRVDGERTPTRLERTFDAATSASVRLSSAREALEARWAFVQAAWRDDQTRVCTDAFSSDDGGRTWRRERRAQGWVDAAEAQRWNPWLAPLDRFSCGSQRR